MSNVADTLADRQSTYGDPAVNFERAAQLLSVFFGPSGLGLFARPITNIEVGHMMILVKLARAMQSPTHLDTLHDIGGYAMCLEQIINGGKK